MNRSPEVEAFYVTWTWRKCRAAFAKSKGNLCERCLKRGIYKPGAIVHHKINLTPETIKDPNVALSFDNLELLCRDCHALAHKPDKRYKVDELGRIISL